MQSSGNYSDPSAHIHLHRPLTLGTSLGKMPGTPRSTSLLCCYLASIRFTLCSTWPQSSRIKDPTTLRDQSCTALHLEATYPCWTGLLIMGDCSRQGDGLHLNVYAFSKQATATRRTAELRKKVVCWNVDYINNQN